MTSVRSLRFCALVAGVALLAAACMGGDDSGAYKEPNGPAQETAKVDAGNFFFRPDTLKLPAGIDRIDMKSESGVHTLVIEGVPDFKLSVDGGGEQDAKKVDLKKGTYTFFCDIPGHREAGMEGTLKVS